jgi:hypothetical protein
MISSEVQRTLVKSPPELWSELSDPEALARHLGALGEIRITRAEPESLVEWEADGASGSVRIKPSGWGTRVTLSVDRELNAPAEPDADHGDLTSEGSTADAQPSDAAPEPDEPAEAVEAFAPTSLEHEPDEPADAAEAFAPAPLGPAAGVTSEADQGPDADEGREAAEDSEHFDAPLDPLDQTIEIQAIRLGPETYAGDLAHQRHEQPGQDELEAPAPLVPRRGFFARLFGWRRRGESAAGQDLEVAERADALDGQPEGEQWWPAPGAEEQGVGGQEDHVLEETEQDAAPAAEPSAPSSAIESLQARFTAMAPEPEVSAEPVPEVSAEPKASAQPEPETSPEPQAEASADEEAEQPAQPPSDLAGELAAAEEVAAEEVTAVLTAVLDRLGAAHHRPFSRS